MTPRAKLLRDDEKKSSAGRRAEKAAGRQCGNIASLVREKKRFEKACPACRRVARAGPERRSTTCSPSNVWRSCGDGGFIIGIEP